LLSASLFFILSQLNTSAAFPAQTTQTLNPEISQCVACFFFTTKVSTVDECGDINAPGLGHVQAMIYAIEKINNDSNLLPNI